MVPVMSAWQQGCWGLQVAPFSDLSLLHAMLMSLNKPGDVEFSII